MEETIITTTYNGGWFKYGTEPRANSLVTYPSTSQWGHVAYVEAVDRVNRKIYISHCGSGTSWFGIEELDWSGVVWNRHYPQGYIYLNSPN